MEKRSKAKFILPVIIGLIAVVIIVVSMGSSGGDGVYAHTVEYDEAELFPAEYAINSTWIYPNGALAVYADEELIEKISVANSQVIKAGDDPTKENVQTVKFGYSSRMEEVFVSVPEYIVFAELAEPIIIDVDEAFYAERGKITEKPIYIDDELAYTVKSCKSEPDENGDTYVAILIQPEAEQEFNMDGYFGDGKSSGINVLKESPSNMILDRQISGGKMYYRDEVSLVACEELLGIEADELSDNCALFYVYTTKEEKSEIDALLNERIVLRVDAISAKVDGCTKSINPQDYAVK